MLEQRDRDIEFGLIFSVLGHGILAFMILFGMPYTYNDFGKQTVYSVTIEGGKNLGGISQVPKDEKSQMAPPKNVQEAPKKTEEKSEPPKQEEKKVEEKKEVPPEDAEISLKEKKEEKPQKENKKEPEKKTDKKEEKKDDKKKQPEKAKEPTSAEINKKLQQAMQRYLGESSDAGGKGFGAGSIGGSGMGGGVVMPPEFFTYKKLLESSVKDGWSWYDTSASILAEVVFEISPSGEISNVRISKSSGNSQYDDSVVRAVMKANPLPPPPSVVYSSFKFVRMYFDPRD